MPVPLALAAPAAAAAVAYLNAKGTIWHDLRILDSSFSALFTILYRQRRDRLNLFYQLEDRATSRSHADKDLLIFEGRRHTYAQVYDRVLRYGAWLKQTQGIKPGEIVGMNFQNSDNFVFMWFGLWSIGAKPAFINYNLTGNALAHCLKVAETRLCIVDPAVLDNVTDDVKQKLPNVNFVVFTPTLEAEAAASPPTRQPDEDRHQEAFTEMAMLIYTSGTTGLPKPAVVSWGKCVSGANIGSKACGVSGSDITYTAMPLYHSAAAVLSFCAVMSCGGTQALGRKFSTRHFWDEVRATNATAIQYVGETLRYLLAAPVQRDPKTGESLDKQHKVRLAYGNGLRPDIWERFQERFGIDTVSELYAATEGTMALVNICANALSAGAMGRTGWIQNVLLSRNMALVEVDWETDLPKKDPATGFCRRVQTGEPGEMLFALPAEDPSQRFQGYYKDPGANAKKVMRNVFKEGDAWFRTGDVVRWDKEGRVFFNDRIGDTFRWKAENVSTAEVSEAVGKHPSVREANVYGVQLPHHDGRAGCAAIYLDPSVPMDEAMRSLATHTLSSLPKYAVPLFLRVVRGEPGTAQTTGTNKQQKHHLRQAGVEPEEKRDADLGQIFWLNKDAYVPFEQKDWQELEGGRVKL